MRYLLLLPLFVGLTASMASSPVSAGVEKTRVDVMIVYTPAVTAHRNGHDHVFAHILNSVELTNLAFENSEVPLYLNLVHAQEIDYVESDSMSTDLGRLRGTDDGHMDEVHGWRTTHGADLVALMRRGAAGRVAGIAYQLNTTNGLPSWAFSVVSDASSAASLLMGHEFGHNFGAAHDHNNSSSGGILEDSYGHRFVGTNNVTYRTVMAYSPGSRVAHFSNPDINYAGVPTGVVATDPQPANNARALRRTGPVVGDYRSQRYPGPDAVFNGMHTITGEERTFADGFLIAQGWGVDGSVLLENSLFASTDGFRLGQGDNAQATLTLVNSTVTSSGSNALLAVEPDSQATVTIGPGSLLNFTSGGTYDRIGHSGEASIEVAPGGTLSTRHAVLADNVGSAATLTLHGEGALWSHNSWYVDIGRRGDAVVNVLDGSLLSGAQRLYVGGSLLAIDERTGVGTLNVSGEGSRVTFAATSNLSFLAVGRQGHGTVNVTDGGDLAVASGSTNTGNIQLAAMPGDTGRLYVATGGSASTTTHLRAGIAGGDGLLPASQGEIVIRGEGSRLDVATYVHLGFAGTGHLQIQDGGEMTSGSNFFMGRSTGLGAAVISGPGSRLDIGDRLHLSADPSRAVTGGTASLLVENGGRVAVANDVVLRSGSDIELRSEGTLQMDGIIDLGAGGNLLLAGGNLALGQSFSFNSPGFQWEHGTVQTKAAALGVTTVPSTSTLLLLGFAAMAAAAPGQAITLGAEAAIRGSGLIASRVDLGQEGTGMVAGETDPTALVLQEGAMGNGVLDTLTVEGGISPGSSTGHSPGQIELRQVRFGAEASLTLRIVGPDQYDQILHDSQTHFSNLSVRIEFIDFTPRWWETFGLFTLTEEGSVDFDLAAIEVPEGWALQEGLLVSEANSFGFTEWAATYELSGGDALPDADPDGDGLTNLQEFAFGTDPTTPVASLLQLSREGDHLLIRWNRRADGLVDYSLKKTMAFDSGSWNAIADATPAVMENPDPLPFPGYERVEYILSNEDWQEAKTFYRVQASFPLLER